MAGFIVAIISGALMSLQGVLNTNVTKAMSAPSDPSDFRPSSPTAH